MLVEDGRCLESIVNIGQEVIETLISTFVGQTASQVGWLNPRLAGSSGQSLRGTCREVNEIGSIRKGWCPIGEIALPMVIVRLLTTLHDCRLSLQRTLHFLA